MEEGWREGGGRGGEGRWKEETQPAGVAEVRKRVPISAAALIVFKSTVPAIHISVTRCVGGQLAVVGTRPPAQTQRGNTGDSQSTRGGLSRA